MTAWQRVAGLEDAELIRGRPRSKPNPPVVARQVLSDGEEFEVIWAWLSSGGRAKLVTASFLE